MRVLLHGNAPHLPTGYGQQMALLAPRIASLGHEVAISAFCGIQGTRSAWNGIDVFPGGLEAYGNDVITGHAQVFGADLVLTLMDAWVLYPDVVSSLNMACWMPVDCTPLSVMDRKFLRESGVTPIAMSEFGRRQLADAGFEAKYAPHGLDTSVFAPGDKAAARAAIGVPQDAYVIGINMANIDAMRKAFPEQFAAFAMFRKAHPEAMLLMHSHQTGPGTGLDLRDMVNRLDIGDAVRWTHPYQYTCGGYSPQEMARWYACLDLYSGCTFAEGFGLPLLEAAACGIPAVTTDFSAMPQVAGPQALKVGTEPFWNPRHQSWWGKPLIGDIAAAYEAAFKSEPDVEAIRAHALTLDADKVFAECWVPILAGLGERLPVAAPAPEELEHA
jgi:glycosyltransferase involved in cell wall biosynthesis